MLDVTNIMDHYRVVACMIWNVGVWPHGTLRHWDSRDRFNEMRRLLFKAIVLARFEAELPGQENINATAMFLRVVPRGAHAVPIMIGNPRKGDRNNYWDDPVREVRDDDVELQFVDYFDWNEMNYIDYQYYRVRIAAFALQPHLVGREALLERQYAKVMLVESEATSSEDES